MLHLTLSLALLFTRSLHNVLSDYLEARKPAARARKRVRLSKADKKADKKDLKEW